MATIIVHGHNEAVGNGVWEDIWERGGVYAWPTAATKVNVSSDDAADTSTGAGARSVIIEGLDANLVEVTETIATAGLSTTTGSVDFFRVNKVYVETAGTYATLTAGSNLGDITVNTTGGDAVASSQAARAGIEVCSKPVRTGTMLGGEEADTSSVPAFAATTSGAPSLSKSPTAIEVGPRPVP